MDGKFDSSKISGKIKEDIEALKTNENLEGKYMNYAEIMRDYKKEGIREGTEYGIEKGKIESIRLLLKEMEPEKIIAMGFDAELVKRVMEEG